MMLFWIAAVAFLVWYIFKQPVGERPAWGWVALGLLAVPGIGMLFGNHMMGGGMMMSGRGGMMHGGRGGMMNGGGMMMGGRGMLMDGQYWWIGHAVLAALVVGAVILAWVLVQRYTKRNTPLSVLQMRLAKGEISPEEFAAAKAQLQG